MPELALATIAFNVDWVIAEQIRLLDAYLADDYTLTVVDNSDDERAANALRAVCERTATEYVRLQSERHMHHDALNAAAEILLRGSAPYIGFLDHDVLPAEPCELIPLVERSGGFLALGQTYRPTEKTYVWPGFFIVERAWLAGRPLDFTGIRGDTPRDDGDTGSGLWPLFADVQWDDLYRLEHGYRVIREPDSYGLQSFGIERLGPMVHLTNTSKWMSVPNPDERERLLRELVAAL